MVKLNLYVFQITFLIRFKLAATTRLLELNEVLDLTTLACQNITFDDCKDVLEFNLERNQIKVRCESVRRDKK